MTDTRPKQLTGIITSDRMQETAVVSVSRLALYPKYKKYHTVSKKFKAHNAANQYKAGDKVVIQETRPRSKDKRWEVVARV